MHQLTNLKQLSLEGMSEAELANETVVLPASLEELTFLELTRTDCFYITEFDLVSF